MWTIPGNPPALFIDIPKTASKSTIRTFDGRRVPPKGRYGHIPAVIMLWGEHPVNAGECFRFSIVRNPWDRMVSLYTCYTRVNKLVPASVSFDDFVMSYELDRWDFCKLTGPLNRAPQVLWLRDLRGNLLVDKVYRFEALDECWSDLERRGYRIHERLWLNRSRSEGSYQEWYTPELVERVAELFAPDVEAFGYEF